MTVQRRPPALVPSSIHIRGDVYLDYLRPDPEAITLKDIATGLSRTCRFGGFIDRWYSVAEHALLTAKIVEQAGGTPDLALAALHHDDHEAYVGDWPTPLKAAIGGTYRRLVSRLDEAIASALGIDVVLFHNDIVRDADRLAMHIEATVMKDKVWFDPPEIPDWWQPGLSMKDARSEFLRAHERLSDACRDSASADA